MVSMEYNQLLSVETDELPNVRIIHMVGECDATTCPMLGSELNKAVIEGKDVVLDVHLLTYIDQSGVQSIVSAREALVQGRKQLCIVGAHGLLTRILQLLQQDGQIPVHQTVDEALVKIAKVNGSTARPERS